MISLRDLEFLSSLARRKHFAQAAEDCGVSQPAFSMRIRKLEEKLGVAIVKRGNRFQGFTSEGKALVRHARKIMDDLKIMEQELHSVNGKIIGTLSIGVIPSAMVYASRAVKHLQTRHPGLQVTLQAATSQAIQQGLGDGEYEVGFTYSEGMAGNVFRIDPLYQETYLLLASKDIAPRSKGTITWTEAAGLPLCLLVSGMQNRSIIDSVFNKLGLAPKVITESNGFTAAMVLATEGLSATIIPQHLLETFSGLEGTVALKLVEPELEKKVCMISPSSDLSLPAVDALREICQEI